MSAWPVLRIVRPFRSAIRPQQSAVRITGVKIEQNYFFMDVSEDNSSCACFDLDLCSSAEFRWSSCGMGLLEQPAINRAVSNNTMIDFTTNFI